MVEARSLVPMDSEGAANPYIVVTLGSYKKKTRVIRTTLNPKWRIGSEAEKFKLYVPSSLLAAVESLFTSCARLCSIFSTKEYSTWKLWMRHGGPFSFRLLTDAFLVM